MSPPKWFIITRASPDKHLASLTSPKYQNNSDESGAIGWKLRQRDRTDLPVGFQVPTFLLQA